ncbi:MAG: DNA repair protein RecN [Mariniphaga sp.]|nr:DNA repair protein RecN [Mariniphaga sp.]
MLTRLRIQNYALIRELDVDLHPGFSIITGETGAGKSILLGALSLILGQRADSYVLKDKSVKCVVEAVFRVDGLGLEELFLANDLDFDNFAIFRREINPAGKSRAFINDSPVMLKTMQEIGIRLIDIHSQNQNLELNSQAFQLMVVDICAGNQELLVTYKENYKDFRKLISDLAEAESLAEKSKADLDYFQFQFDQLYKAVLIENEQELLEKELEILTHAEEIKAGLSNVAELLNGENISALIQVKTSIGLISKLKNFLPDADGLSHRLESLYVDLKDVADEADSIGEKVEYDPDRIGSINERLDLIYSLQQKHHVKSVDELIVLRNSLEAKILAVFSNEEEIQRLVELKDLKKAEVEDLSKRLSVKRQSVAEEIEMRVIRQLLQLGMPNSKFKVDISSLLSPGTHGMDTVSFLFTANKNGVLCEISKVASGGEMSRVMLAIKALISKSKALPTIIFDEIDAGVSGDIAERMGIILKEISADMQVINITHLPQIAARGDHHFLVYKQDSESETTTRLKLLTKSERIEELAKMLSGENITAAAILNAEELLK